MTHLLGFIEVGVDFRQRVVVFKCEKHLVLSGRRFRMVKLKPVFISDSSGCPFPFSASISKMSELLIRSVLLFVRNLVLRAAVL